MPTLNTLSVRVFRNLTRRCYSIQAKVGGSWRTVAHADAVLVEPATFKVSEAGRQRTLATGRKQVHAWVYGQLVRWSGRAAPGLRIGDDAYVALAAALTPSQDVSALFDRAMAVNPNVLRETLRYNPRKGATFTATLPGHEHLAGRSVTMARAVLMTPAGMVSASAV